MTPHRCDMSDDCQSAITHLDEKGYIYCTTHGHERKNHGVYCRALLPWEAEVIKRVQILTGRYQPMGKREAIAAGYLNANGDAIYHDGSIAGPTT